MYMYLTYSIGFDPKELEFQIVKKYRYNFFFYLKSKYLSCLSLISLLKISNFVYLSACVKPGN